MTCEPEHVFLETGELYFGGGCKRVRTVLGSCVAITLWHPRLRIGGICHYLLPRPTASRAAGEMTAMYAEGAIRLFMRELRRAKARPEDFVAKMFGGGNMFGGVTSGERSKPLAALACGACGDVASMNVEIGRELLRRSGFRIAAENVGGWGSRVVVFELWSGDVWVRRGPELRCA
jgi:chemotaxis protein CheD